VRWGGNGVLGTISPSSMAICFPISEPLVFFLDLVNALESIDKNDVA
jgi:hypothetical protein